MVVLLEVPGPEIEIDIAKEVLELNSKSQLEAVAVPEGTVSTQLSSKNVEQEQADFEPAQLAADPIQNSHLQY